MQKTPVLIMGAGPAGCSAALGLSKHHIPALLVDQANFPRDKICGDALSGKVVMALRRINPALEEELSFQSFAKGSHGVMFYAPNGKALRVPFRRNAEAETAPGFISRRMDFDQWLFQKASAAPGIQTITGVRLHVFQKIPEGWLVSDAEGKYMIQTEILIVADGAQSKFAREFGGIDLENEHYCAGIRAYYKGVKNLDEQGYIELHFFKDFLPGYFWIFPLPNGYANVGIGMRSDVVAKKRINLKEAMLGLIKEDKALSLRFSDAIIEGNIKGFGLPLGSKKRKISGEGFMLLGDAGSLIDPFTGEGIGNAMISGLKAAEVISECKGEYTADQLIKYDEAVYKRLWPELNLSRKMQQLVTSPFLFNLVVNKANRSPTLQETISCMFEDIDLRNRLRDPRFYLKVLFE
jgi:geranylgeranyl reductase family protein